MVCWGPTLPEMIFCLNYLDQTNIKHFHVNTGSFQKTFIHPPWRKLKGNTFSNTLTITLTNTLTIFFLIHLLLEKNCSPHPFGWQKFLLWIFSGITHFEQRQIIYTIYQVFQSQTMVAFSEVLPTLDIHFLKPLSSG